MGMLVYNTHYNVSGGPMMRTSHLYMSLSSINPAEKPSTGFLFSSENNLTQPQINDSYTL